MIDSQKNFNILVFYGGQYNELNSDKGDSTKLMLLIDNISLDSPSMLAIENKCSINSGIKHN